MGQTNLFKTYFGLILPVVFLAGLPLILKLKPLVLNAGPEKPSYGTRSPIPVLESIAHYSGRTANRIVGRWHADNWTSVTTEYLANGTWRNISCDGKTINSGTYKFLNEHDMVLSQPAGYTQRVYVGVNTMTYILSAGQWNATTKGMRRSTSKLPNCGVS